jgi:hypothetical protein
VESSFSKVAKSLYYIIFPLVKNQILKAILWHFGMYTLGNNYRSDFARRKKHYVSDWTDAFDNIQQCIPAILFLYFSCLAPAVSFGTIASQITEGSLGVAEFLIGSGGAGMVSFSCLWSHYIILLLSIFF